MSAASLLLAGVAARARRWDFATTAHRGRRLGNLLYGLDRRHRRLALTNLALAFPERSEDWRREVARASFQQAGRTAVEMLWATGMSDRSIEGVLAADSVEPLRQHLAAGTGIIMATGHYGNWELIGVAFGLLGIPCVSVARPLDDPDLDGLLTGFRTRTGSEIVPKKNSVRQILRALRSGKAVAILMDQNTQRHEAVFAPFFGRLAATPPAIAHLHLRTGAPIVPTFAVPDGPGYTLRTEPPIVAETDDREAAILQITTEFNRRLEGQIRRLPEPWLWMHDRWRERPLGEGET